MKQVFLSVVIPCYDEMANLRKGVLDKVRHYLNKQKYSYEVIIVDDGSIDGSIEFIKEFVRENNEKFHFVQNPHLGKAGAVTTGVLKAKGEIVLFTDMDQATPIEEVEKILPYFDKGYAIVIGSRKNRRKGSPLSRRFISRSAMVLRRVIIGLSDISDTQCGFKAFRYDTATKLFSYMYDLHQGFKEISGSAVTAGFDVELLFLAEKMGYKTKEVPVSWLYVESRRVSPVRDSIEGVLDLLRIRKNDMLGRYKNV